jgi:hypothetical protein
MFKLPNTEHQEKLLALYKTVRDTSTKVKNPHFPAHPISNLTQHSTSQHSIEQTG